MVDLSMLTEHSSSAACEPYRVLVVEDGKSVAEVLAMFFELEGMETAIAFDGVQAVDTAESFHPHLVCMDLLMPKMDGYEAARRIRERFQNNVILVALCGWDDADSRRRTAEAGFDHHLVKPVSPDDLRNMIGRCLRNSSSRDSNQGQA